MANNQSEKNRVKYGAGFLALLLLANFIVRFVRNASPARPLPTSNNSQPITANPVVTPVSAPIESTFAGDFKPNNTDLQIQTLKEMLEGMSNEIKEIPMPFEPPDTSISLFLMRKDLFQVSKSFVASLTPSIASATDNLPATFTENLELIGSFDADGQKKLMVKRGQEIFLVVENSMNSDAEISLLSYIDGDYTLIDKSGKEFVVKLKRQTDENVDKIVEMLRSPSHQTSYNQAQLGTETVEIKP